MFEAFVWEIENSDSTPDAETYWRYREHFVAVYPYLELWRLALQLPLQVVSPVMEQLERLSVEMTVLVNDLLSVRRDRQHGKHNLVFSLAKELDGSCELGAIEATRMLHARVVEFEQLRTGVDTSDSRLRDYVSFLGAIPEGTRMAMMHLRARYPRSNAEASADAPE
jgi:hypothetical protein